MKKNVKDYKPNANPNQNKNVNLKSKGSNSMKKNRRITAILTAACLAMPLACTAAVPFGTIAAGNNQITISNVTGVTSVPAAYQVFTGTYENSTLVVSGWGNGINASDFITALKGSTVFGTTNPFNAVTYNAESPAASAVAVAEIISDFSTDKTKVQEVAKIAVRNVSATSSGSVSGNVISGLDDGYYVIKDTATAAKHDDIYYLSDSLGMLQVAGGEALTIAPKIGLPTVKKEVQENNSTKDWGKAADYNCGDAVPFKITITLPDNIDMYDHYYLKVVDTLGSYFNKPTANDFSITIGGTEVSIDGNNCRFDTFLNQISISFEDIKALKGNVTKDDTIVIEYTAVLKGNATDLNDYGYNSNKAEITFSNNPNYNYNPNITDTVENKPDENNRGTSPKDIVKVYTYNLAIHKIDGVTEEELEGVKFKIKNSKGKWAKKNTSTEDGAAPILWVDDESNAGIFETGTGGFIEDVMGIDAGEYTIKEIEALDGYNLAADTILTISPTYADTELTKLEYQIGDKDPVANDLEEDGNTVTVEIENNKGTTLPTTGGIGTKIFYIVGGMLVVGSGAALVIKKRVGKDEE